eukprot:scaffold49492_cov72-Phaeocystis_antarctica.AAC.7
MSTSDRWHDGHDCRTTATPGTALRLSQTPSRSSAHALSTSRRFWGCGCGTRCRTKAAGRATGVRRAAWGAPPFRGRALGRGRSGEARRSSSTRARAWCGVRVEDVSSHGSRGINGRRQEAGGRRQKAGVGRSACAAHGVCWDLETCQTYANPNNDTSNRYLRLRKPVHCAGSTGQLKLPTPL